MRNFLSLVLVALFLFSCDDGDVITVELDFQGNLELCDNNTEDYIIYETKTNPNESLSLVFDRSTANDLIFSPEESPFETTLNINGSSVLFNYRTYNQEPTFCNIIADPDLVVTQDFSADSGEAVATSVIVDSDDDGISNEDENESTNQDSDGDGIPDYIDQDDDNDNVPTRNEDDNADGDDNPLTNPRDTDNDGIPDYLDDDDDGDGILTRLEDENENTNPIDDFEESSPNPGTPRFLDPDAMEAFGDSGFIQNQYTRTVTTTFIINNVDLGIISYDSFNLGTYSSSSTITSE